MPKKTELAQEKFLAGYNCAQAVLIAFCDEIGMDEPAAAKLASSFGGGMGQLREVCGAVSAMLMIVGATAGYDDPADKEGKKTQYETVRALAETFAETNGSYLCRDLLANAKANTDAVVHERTREFYRQRPCLKYVTDAVEQTEAFLARRLSEEIPNAE